MHLKHLFPLASLGALLPLLAVAHAPSPRAASLASRPAHRPRQGYIITSCTVPNTVALTLDDGPYHYTSSILDLLDQYQAKVTFFVNGANWATGIDDPSTPWPGLLRRMFNSGHQIGSHTWSHVDLTAADTATRRAQLQYLEQALINVLGVYPSYLRPPYATCDFSCLTDVEAMGYRVVNFDVDTKDYLNNTPDTVRNSMNTFKAALDDPARNSLLVLAHDVHQETALTLVPYMLEEIRRKGYRAVTVGECLGDSGQGWYRVPAAA